MPNWSDPRFRADFWQVGGSTNNRILLLGGTGFVGRCIAHVLSARGYSVTVPTRRRERARDLLLLPTVEVVERDVHDAATLGGYVRAVTP